jgi:hypothetical protein
MGKGRVEAKSVRMEKRASALNDLTLPLILSLTDSKCLKPGRKTKNIFVLSFFLAFFYGILNGFP